MLPLAASRAAFALSGLVVNLAMTRWLSREDFGVYRWMMAVTAVVAFASTLGLGARLTRELVRSPERAAAEVGGTVRAVALSSIASGFAVVAYVALRDPRPEVIATAFAAALGLGLLAQTQMLEAALHGMHQTRLEVMPVLVGRLLLVVGNLALLWWGFGVLAVMLGRAVATLATLVLLIWAWRAVPVVPSDERVPVRELWTQGRTFGATVFFGAVYAQADILMLEVFSHDAEVARYGAPSSVVLQLALVSTVLTRGFFPRLAAVAQEPARAQELIARQDAALMFIALPVAAGGATLARDLAPALFGPGYADAATPLLLLCLTVPLRFLHSGYGLALTAMDGHQERAKIDRQAAVLNVAMNLVALPLWGAVGAAVTTLLTDLFLAWRTQGALRDRIGPVGDGHASLPALVSATGMAVGVWLLPASHVALRVGAGVVLYVALAWATGAWSRRSVYAMRHL